MSQSRENLRTDGRTDRPYFIGPFRPRPGVQLLTNGIKLYGSADNQSVKLMLKRRFIEIHQFKCFDWAPKRLLIFNIY